MTTGGAVCRVFVAFSGSRLPSETRRKLVQDALASLPMGATVHVGDCPTGVDRYVWEAIKTSCLTVRVFKADWQKHGRRAGPLRNAEMLRGCSMLYAFPCDPSEGESRGTYDAIRQAEAMGLTVRVFSGIPVKRP